MTGRDGTALRSLAAIAQALSVLSGSTYVGDLPNSGWRVFNTTHDGLVAVITTGNYSRKSMCHVIMLYCAVLCCAVLCCAVLCCAVLCCAVLCCAVLCCAV
jgi:hypothetical protein